MASGDGALDTGIIPHGAHGVSDFQIPKGFVGINVGIGVFDEFSVRLLELAWSKKGTGDKRGGTHLGVIIFILDLFRLHDLDQELESDDHV